jgi:hypothetical protein
MNQTQQWNLPTKPICSYNVVWTFTSNKLLPLISLAGTLRKNYIWWTRGVTVMYRHVNQDSNLRFSILLYMNRSQTIFKSETRNLTKELGTKWHTFDPIAKYTYPCLRYLCSNFLNLCNLFSSILLFLIVFLRFVIYRMRSTCDKILRSWKVSVWMIYAISAPLVSDFPSLCLYTYTRIDICLASA